jgi:hypothetical protein
MEPTFQTHTVGWKQLTTQKNSTFEIIFLKNKSRNGLKKKTKLLKVSFPNVNPEKKC